MQTIKAVIRSIGTPDQVGVKLPEIREETHKVKQEMTDNKKGLADADLTI